MAIANDERVAWKAHLENLPSLRWDQSFLAMTSTQFLGAFNDNLFKQLVLLLSTDIFRSSGQPGTNTYQMQAAFFFTLPFVLFSGFAGYISDRYAKRLVIIMSKVAEIVVVAMGAWAFYSGYLWPLTVALFFMGMQSAFFGPSKYGVLSEMFRSRDLPTVNSVFIMTTFIAIILGTYLAGPLKEDLGSDRLWLASMACLATAIVGTITAYFVRPTPIAQPGLRFRPSALAIDKATWRLMRRDKSIRNVLYITSVFWMIGLVIQLGTNDFGLVQLGLTDTRSTTMLVGVAVGIAIGCVIAAKLSKGTVSFALYRVGNAGLVFSLTGIGLLGFFGPNYESEIHAAAAEQAQLRKAEPTYDAVVAPPSPLLKKLQERPVDGFEWACRGFLLLAGISAGLFTVPLQTFLQLRPPDEEKGRVIAAANLLQWTGILLASVLYGIVSLIISRLEMPQATHFLSSAVVMAMLFLYRLDDRRVEDRPVAA